MFRVKKGWAVGPWGGTRSAAVEKREDVGDRAVMMCYKDAERSGRQ